MSPLDGIDLSGPKRTLQAGRRVQAADVERQTATAGFLLGRLGGGWPVQLLADEVGMGKTYVALAVASALRPAASACRVAVLVPNRVLADKWNKEVREFNETCVMNPRLRLRPGGPNGTFSIDDLDDLAGATSRRQLTIIRYGSHGLASKRLVAASERVAAAAWALSLDSRLASHKQALRGAFVARSRAQINAGFADAVKRLRLDERPLLPLPVPTGKDGQPALQLAGRSGRRLWEEAIGAVLTAPKAPYKRLHDAVQDHLRDLARAALLARIKPFDLVVVDEAHNWVNGANGADAARLAFLHQARHALLLTATPLQLDAKDLPSLLSQFADLGAALHNKPPALLAADVGVISKHLAKASQEATRFRVAWEALRPDAEVTVTSAAVVVDDERAQSAIAELHEANRRLEQALRPWLIRHRRSRTHRRVLVGKELAVENLGPRRPEIAERTVLHSADGTESSQAELAQLALMRLVGLAVAGRRTTLAASMTGCYTTVTQSEDGKHLLKTTPETQPYKNLIQPYIDTEQRLLKGNVVRVENLHPKLQTVLGVAEGLWREGEKLLVYCWRVPTATVVFNALRLKLGARAADPAWTRLQSRLSRPPLLAAAQDRVVHSLCLAGRIDTPYDGLVEQTREEATAALLAYGIPSPLRPVNLSVLHNLHQAVLASAAVPAAADPRTKSMLMVLSSRRPVVQPKVPAPPSKAQTGVINAILDEPALLTGPVRSDGTQEAHRCLATALDRYTEKFGPSPGEALRQREELVRLLASSVRSTHTLSRLPGLHPETLPDARALAAAVARPMRPGGMTHGAVSMLDRLASLVDEYAAIEDPENLRVKLDEFRASQERDPVALVTGKTKHAERVRLFNRFNSPLFPDVLVCTQIGGEGIDLHRFCRVVIHFDLSFNPAKLEQRTGRCDRIGSKAELDPADLIVGVPLLAGSYDERIYATLLERDREQEALIGSGVGGENSIAALEDDLKDQLNETTAAAYGSRPIPPALVEHLRCNYHVWREGD